MTEGVEERRASRLQATLALDEPVTRISGVSSARATLLSKLGIRTVRDLLAHYPHRYMDMTNVQTTATARIGERCTISGTVYEAKSKRIIKRGRRLAILEASIVDSDGVLIATFFNQPWLEKSIKPGTRLMVSGKYEFNYGFARMTSPYMEVMESDDEVGRVIPVHHATGKLPAASVRRIVRAALDATSGMYDPLPLKLRSKRALVNRNSAISSIHFPASMDEADMARRRLAYEELLYMQLFLMSEDERRNFGSQPTSHVVDGERMAALEKSLPFELTEGQKSAKAELLESMSSPQVASHMLIGDVGTGKTAVAAFGFAVAADTGGQGLLLAPTEVLALQHGATLGALFDESGISYAVLTGSTDPEDRSDILSGYADGSIDVLIGTHAVLEPDVMPVNLTFVAIDEQQRFGVEQREAALSKGESPDALFMTATPIPRSLALALFGNMSISYLRERPRAEGRRVTKALHSSQKGVAFDGARAALDAGRQVYVVCPLVGVGSEERDERSAKGGLAHKSDDSYHPSVVIEDELDYTGDNPVAAREERDFLQSRVFPDRSVGLLHGSMPPAEKQEVMERFRDGLIDVLVSTVVIEVGVDVPNASVMIVEDADRFGLSQLHQLRGRVGRDGGDSEVYLLSASMQEKALKRLAVLESCDDGLEIAEHDLSMRREGDILGNRQSGASSLKIVNISKDMDLIEQAHEDARAIMNEDPMLRMPDHAAMAREVRIMFSGDSSRLGG